MKYDVIIPAGVEYHDCTLDKRYEDKVLDSKPFQKLRGRPLLQHVLDELMASEKDPIAEQLGLRDWISSVTIVGPKQTIDDVISFRHPKTKAIDQGSSLISNIRRAVCSYYDDNRNLPDPKIAYRYITGEEGDLHDIEQFLDNPRGNKVRAVTETLASIAKMIESSGRGYIFMSEAVRQIQERDTDLKKRGILAQSHSTFTDLYDLILKNLDITHEQLSFRDPECQAYFADFYNRLEKEFLIVTCDIPLLNPGVLSFIDRCSRVEGDFKKGVTTMEQLTPYYEQKGSEDIDPSLAYRMRHRKDFLGIVRPYIQLEHLTRLLNLTMVKPNKISNLENLEQAFGIRKQRKLRNMAMVLLKLPWDAKKYGFYAVAAYTINSYELRDRFPFRRIYAHMRFEGLTYANVESVASQILGTDAKMVFCPYGAVSLDVDHVRDLQAFEKYYGRWRDLQKEVDPNMELSPPKH